MLLALYVGSTLYVWFDAYRHHRFIKRKLKEEGYEFTNKGFYLADLLLGLCYIGFLSIPVINLVSPIVNHNRERSYDEQKNYLEEAGSIDRDEEYDVKESIDTKVKDKINEAICIQKVDDIEDIDKKSNYYYPDLEDDKSIDQDGYTLKKVYKRK